MSSAHGFLRTAALPGQAGAKFLWKKMVDFGHVDGGIRSYIVPEGIPVELLQALCCRFNASADRPHVILGGAGGTLLPEGLPVELQSNTFGKDPAALEAGASRGRAGDERVRCSPFETTAHDEVEDFT
jgi:hypothetical protein